MHHRSGSILVLVLFVLVVLSMVSAGLAYRAGLESRSVRDRAIWMRLKVSAESAAQIAIARLAENTNDFDHPSESWSMHDPIEASDWHPDWAPSSTGVADFWSDYQVIDEEGKLHLSHASSEALQKLGMTTEQISSLRDWIDSDEDSSTQGAESKYYLSLPRPYRAKNAELEFLDELLAVRGFAREGFWASHGELLSAAGDASSTDAAVAAAALGWVDLITCHGGGKLNLNTAPIQVLRTLPLSEGAAEQIARFTDKAAAQTGKLEEHVFRSAKDIDQLQGLTRADRDVLKSVGVFRSSYYRIFARAQYRVTGREYRLHVLVRTKDQSPPQILQWQEGP